MLLTSKPLCRLSGCLCTVNGWLCRLNGCLCTVNRWLCRLSGCLCTVNRWLCRLSGCLCTVNRWLCRLSGCLFTVNGRLCRLSGCLCTVNRWLCRLSGWLCQPTEHLYKYLKGWIWKRLSRLHCTVHYLKGCQWQPTECLAIDCWSDWTLFEWITMLLDWLAVPADWISGCAHCLSVWQCQPSASLVAHIVWRFGSANPVSGWLRTLLEWMTADYREAGCTHCLNRLLLQLSGRLCQLAGRMPVLTGRREMPVPDFEHKLHEPPYARRHALGNCGL